MRTGYRNSDKDFNIDSDDDQFGFDLTDLHLKVDFFEKIKGEIAPIERVNFYLHDKRLLKNIFIVAGSLAYYYEKAWYYKGHPQDKAPPPEKSLFERFNFIDSDVLLIKADNNPKPAISGLIWRMLLLPLTGWLIFPPENRLDDKASIEKNIFIKVDKWEALPYDDSEDLYRKR